MKVINVEISETLCVDTDKESVSDVALKLKERYNLNGKSTSISFYYGEEKIEKLGAHKEKFKVFLSVFEQMESEAEDPDSPEFIMDVLQAFMKRMGDLSKSEMAKLLAISTFHNCKTGGLDGLKDT